MFESNKILKHMDILDELYHIAPVYVNISLKCCFANSWICKS